MLLWVALPHPDTGGEWWLIGLVAAAWLVAAALVTGRLDGVSRATMTAVMALAALLLTGALLAIGDPASGFALFYVCLAPFAFAAGPRRHGWGLLALIGVLYGAVLAITAAGAGEEQALADALAARWLAVVLGGLALGLFARHLGQLRRTSEDRFRRGFSGSPVGMAILSGDWCWLEVNDALCRMLGRSREDLIGCSPVDVTHPDDVAASRGVLAHGSGRQELVKRYVRPDGEVVWAAVESLHVPGRRTAGRSRWRAERDSGWFYAHILDITAQRASQEAVARQARQQAAIAALGRLALEEQELETVLDHAAGTIAGTLAVELCEVFEVTPRGSALRLAAGAGWPDGELRRALVPAGPETQVGYTIAHPEPVVTTDIASEPRFAFPTVLAEAGARSGITVTIGARDRVWGVLGAHGRAPRSFAPDEADFLRAVANVISSAVNRNLVDEELRHRALHDPLTGLPNRALALDRLEGALARRRRDGRAVAVLMADLDQFKLVNDSLGHKAGDDLLVALASRLAGRRAAVGHDRAPRRRRVPRRLRAARRRARGDPRGRARGAGDQPAGRAGRRRALHHREHRHRARRQRRAPSPRTCCATPTPRCTARRSAAAAATSCSTTCCAGACCCGCAPRASCAAGIARGELRLDYQPVVELVGGRVTAVEALVRWQHPDRGLLGPVDFIPVAEDSGLIGALGDWVLDTACRDGPPGSGASRARRRCTSASTPARASSPTRPSPRASPT